MSQPVHILHLHSTFALGGKEARAVRLMNAFGNRARHTIVSSMPEQLDARAAIAPGIKYEIALAALVDKTGARRMSLANSAGIALGPDYAFDLERHRTDRGGDPQHRLCRWLLARLLQQGRRPRRRTRAAGDQPGVDGPDGDRRDR
eukprot:gene43133-58406_t